MATRSSIFAWRIPMDRRAWWATAHGVAKSRTRLSENSKKSEFQFGKSAGYKSIQYSHRVATIRIRKLKILSTIIYTHNTYIQDQLTRNISKEKICKSSPLDIFSAQYILFKSTGPWDFPGSPVVKTPGFHCRGYSFNPSTYKITGLPDTSYLLPLLYFSPEHLSLVNTLHIFLIMFIVYLPHQNFCLFVPAVTPALTTMPHTQTIFIECIKECLVVFEE